MRESDFSGSTFNGAYLEKAVAYKANFSGESIYSSLLLLTLEKKRSDAPEVLGAFLQRITIIMCHMLHYTRHFLVVNTFCGSSSNWKIYIKLTCYAVET